MGVGSVHDGFRIRDSKTVIVSCDQIFNRSDLRRKGRRRLGKAIDSFLDLKDGNLIVHLSHGIGRYRGLKMLEKDGQHTEHMELEFAAGTRIYVPAAKIDLVQKYIGGSKTTPRLAKIGGTGWQKRKASVESAITDMAAEMIDLQAKRQGRSGIAMRMETQWQHEFEQSFPVPRNARPADSDRIDQGRPGKFAADGATAVRRCRFRKNRSRNASGFQSG